MVKNVDKVQIPSLNLANLPKKQDDAPKLTSHPEKAPRLGFGNALLISLKAIGGSIGTDKTYASIRSGLKEEVITTKIEQRNERLIEKFQGTEQDRTALKGDLQDRLLTRKLKLPTEPTGFFNKVENLEMKEAGKKNGLHSHESTLTDLLPKQQLSGNKEAVDAHFSNLASRIIRELDAKGFAPEDRGTAFKEVFAELVVREMDLSNAKLLTPDQFEQAARRFTSDSRTDKAEIMQIIADTLCELRDPNSDVMMRIKVNGFDALVGELGNLKPTLTTDTTYLRNTISNELFLTGAAQGGYKIIESSRDFVQTLPKNQSFKQVETKVEGMLKDMPVDKVKFGNLNTPDTVRSLGTLAMQMISAISTQDMASDFRSFVADVMDTIKSQVGSREISKEVGQLAHKLFSESSILLRYVVPEVAQGKMEGAGAQRTLMVLSQFVQMIANDQDAPVTFNEDMKQAFNEVKASVREKLQDFLTLLDVPTPEEFGDELDQAFKNSITAEKKEMEDSLFLPDDDDIEVEDGEVDVETLNAQKLVNQESDRIRKIGSEDAQPKNNPQNNPEQGKIAQNTLPNEVVIEEIDTSEDEGDSEDIELDTETQNAQRLVDPKSVSSKDEVISDKTNNIIDELQRPEEKSVLNPLDTPPGNNPPN